MEFKIDESKLAATISGCFSEALKKSVESYNSPFTEFASKAIEANKPAIIALIDESFKELIASQSIREEIKDALKAQIARLLIQKFGGEIEKQVNELKANPLTRAQITNAVTAIIEKN